MKKHSRIVNVCLLSVFAILVGISQSAEAHTVDLAYRCEVDGSVTFFAATDHHDAKGKNDSKGNAKGHDKSKGKAKGQRP